MASSMGDMTKTMALAQEAAEAFVLRGDCTIFGSNINTFMFPRLFEIALHKIQQEQEEKIRHNAKQFHLFPKLPVELQREIWKDAMTGVDKSHGHRILRVKVDVLRGMTHEKELKMKFAVSKKKKEYGSLVTTPEALDLRVSLACHASRAIYLSTFKHTLPTGKKGLSIRYDDNTTIYIENLNIAANHPLFRKAVLQISGDQIAPSLEFPAYLGNIRKLILPRACFNDKSRFTRKGCGIAGLVPLFKGLKLIAAEFHTYRDDIQNDLQVMFACATAAALRTYVLEVDPKYKIPSVGVMEGERADGQDPYQIFVRYSDDLLNLVAD